MNLKMRTGFPPALGIALLSLASASAGLAEDPPVFPRWLLHVDAAGVVPHPSADLSIAGNSVPGAALSIDGSATVTADLSYFLTPNIAVNLYSGVPPHGVITGAGSLQGAGVLANSRYGPIIFSAEYHFTGFRAFKPYVGIGPGYAVFLNTHDGSLAGVKIQNSWGVGFGIGADYDITRRLTLNAYARQMILSTTVTASFAGAPARSHTTLNPTLFGIGIGYRF